MPLGLKQALITYCNHPALLSWKCIALVTIWVIFLCHRNQLNVLVEFRVPGCLLWELAALRELESHRGIITPSSRFGHT